MIKKIVKDPMFLSQKSTPATEADAPIIQDLRDTLLENKSRCVGMAANMIGERKRILIADNGFFPLIMLNPFITKKTGPYKTQEGCLSLEGVRDCTRYHEIEVDYLDQVFKPQHGKFSGFTAQIIQHEMDHFEGIII